MESSHNNNRISHDYKDYGLEAALLEGQQPQRSAGAPSHNDAFPVQLHWMLEETDKKGLSHVVSWSPHGRAFAVRDRDHFVEKILPVYFKQSKITSFQRQLSLYGFKRITKGPDSGSYYHPKFLRTSRMFVRNIVRTKVKNDGPRKAAAPEAEPDLYSMPRLPDPIAVLPDKKAELCPNPRFIHQFDAPQQIPFGGIHRVSGVEANISSAGISPEPEFCRNRVLARQLLQQQISQMEGIMNARKTVSLISFQPPISGSVLSSRKACWLNGASSPVTIPEVAPSNTRPSLVTLAGLPCPERLNVLLAATGNGSSFSNKTIADLIATQHASLSLRSFNNENIFSMGLR